MAQPSRLPPLRTPETGMLRGLVGGQGESRDGSSAGLHLHCSWLTPRDMDGCFEDCGSGYPIGGRMGPRTYPARRPPYGLRPGRRPHIFIVSGRAKPLMITASKIWFRGRLCRPRARSASHSSSSSPGAQSGAGWGPFHLRFAPADPPHSAPSARLTAG